ncbi:MAG: hypothetical protein IKF38_02070 [Clostridia bacterium]|nr:hypothetical protein [Clostridia bacterium]
MVTVDASTGDASIEVIGDASASGASIAIIGDASTGDASIAVIGDASAGGVSIAVIDNASVGSALVVVVVVCFVMAVEVVNTGDVVVTVGAVVVASLVDVVSKEFELFRTVFIVSALIVAVANSCLETSFPLTEITVVVKNVTAINPVIMALSFRLMLLTQSFLLGVTQININLT